MSLKLYRIIGVMSGTSLDGIDLAEIEFQLDEANKWNYTLLKTTTIPYPKTLIENLKNAIYFSKEKMRLFNENYTYFLGGVIFNFIKKNDLKNLDAVCSHGHTVWHQPENRLTFQIGNLPKLAHIVKQKIICDFRVQDVALGGNGAPLVPIGDRLLFSAYDYCVNLGGFANISFESEKIRFAYDVCPVNIVLNEFAEKLGKPYDDQGFFASKGTLNPLLLAQLNQLKFYKKKHPKSLGLEWVQKEVLPLIELSNVSEQDVLCTLVEHIAIQLSLHFKKKSTVLITGGGAYNDYLLSRIAFHSDIKIEIPSKKLIEYKEALIFGLLGVLKIRNEINCLASVTGALKDHSSGFIYS